MNQVKTCGDFASSNWQDDLYGKGALSGYISRMGSTFVTEGLGKFNLQDSNKQKLGENVFNTEKMETFNTLAGGLTGNLIEYGMNGETTLNVANFEMFSKMFGLTNKEGKAYSGGMMEMRIGGDGALFNAGVNGTDVSYGNLSASYQGLRETTKIAGYKLSGVEGKSTLNMINGLSYTSGNEKAAFARKIFEKEIDVKYGSGIDENGEGYKGYYDNNNPKEIMLNRQYLGLGEEKAAKLASIVGHELSHLAGNKKEAIAHAEGLKTYNELVKEWNIKDADEKHINEMIKEIYNPANGQENIGGRDYWKVTKDKEGNILKIENDGSNDVTFVDEYGTQTGFAEYTEGSSRTDSLGKQLEITKKDANQMLINAGYTLNTETGLFEGPNAKQAFDITGKNELPVGSKEQGFFDGVKDIFNSVVADTKDQYNSAKEKVSTLLSGLKNFLSREDTTESSAEYQALEKKFKEIEGLPYADDFKNQQKLDEKGLITKDSTAMNCIGFVSYLFGFRADFSVANFDKYSMFEKLSGINSFKDLQIGDVIRFRAGTDDNHVSIWAGNGKVIESVSSARKPGVRIDDISRMTNYYNRAYGNKYVIDYFRYSLSEGER